MIAIIHYPGYSENYVNEEDDFYTNVLFNPSGIQTKIVSKVQEYKLKTDKRPTTSLSTAYLELSLHSQSGGAITLNSTNELKLSFVSSTGIGNFDDFSNKTLAIQQYNPSNPSASYPAYDVRDVIDDNAGVITLARLDGSYDSEVPYAYFKVGFS